SAVRASDRLQPDHLQRRVVRPHHHRSWTPPPAPRSVPPTANRPGPRARGSHPYPGSGGARGRLGPRPAGRRYISLVVFALRTLSRVPPAVTAAARPARRCRRREPTGRGGSRPLPRRRLGGHSQRRGYGILPPRRRATVV